MSEYVLEMIDVSKSFPGVKALDHAQLKLRPGRVHALMGENGAGKSTLMKCMFGIYKMDHGQIKIDGQPVTVSDPMDALNKGIAMVHQELQPIPARTVGENIFLGRYPMKKLLGFIPVIDHKKMYEDTAGLLKKVRMHFDPRQKVGDLSVSQMQSVEIAKAVSANCRVLILDEPTSSLTANEVEALFRIIEDLKAENVAIVYISHKMDEILRISDDVTIMRDGCYIGTWEAKELTIAACPTGTAEVLGKTSCIVAETAKKLHTYREISCGKCVFCREGLIQLEYEQNEITKARGKAEFEGYAQEIGDAMHTQTLCSVGQNAGDCALSAFEKFQDEYDQHIKKNNCPAGVCAAFSHLYIDPQACTGCGDCLDVCPVDAILGKPGYIHMIEDLDCTRCGKCVDVCEENAILRASGKLPKLPQRLVKVGKFKRHG